VCIVRRMLLGGFVKCGFDGRVNGQGWIPLGFVRNPLLQLAIDPSLEIKLVKPVNQHPPHNTHICCDTGESVYLNCSRKFFAKVMISDILNSTNLARFFMNIGIVNFMFG
jgi:hypothetical protein